MSVPNNPQENPLDLSSLQSLNFGPDWATSSKPRPPSAPRDSGGARRGDFGDRPRFDRRPDRRAGGAPRRSENDTAAGSFSGERRDRPPRRTDDTRPPRREGDRPDFSRGPRREFDGHRDRFSTRQPRPAPAVDVAFFPEEKPFAVLTKAAKASLRTYELFEIARLILEKNDRFVVGCRPVDAETNKDAKLYQSVPDQLPFLSESDAVAHVLQRHLDLFFTQETVTVDPPKGSFQMVSKCGFTGEILGPPNYHGYQQALREHHATRLPRMAFEKFTSRIESVRDPEQINQWLQRMTQVTRYTLKDPKEGEPAQFDTLEAARSFLLTHRKDQAVRSGSHLRFPGKAIELLPIGPLRSTIEAELTFQRNFPLNTANAIRGRLRKMGFTLYKRGSKGVTYVSAVRRQFRTPQTIFADSIQKVFDFIEKNPDIKIVDLPAKFLGLSLTPPTETTPTQPEPSSSATAAAPEKTPAPAPETAPVETVAATEPPGETTDDAAPAVEAPEAVAETTPATNDTAASKPPVSTQSAAAPTAPPLDLSNPAVHALLNTVRWLVSEGYVTEFSDGRLFALPVLTEAQVKAARAEDETRPRSDDTDTESLAATEDTPSSATPESAHEPLTDSPEKQSSEQG